MNMIEDKHSAPRSKSHWWLSATLFRRPKLLRCALLVVFTAACFTLTFTHSRADQIDQLLDEAGTFLANKDYEHAVNKYEMAVSAMRRQGYDRGEGYASTLTMLGMSQLYKGDYTQAKQNLKSAIKLLSKKSEFLFVSELNLAQVYKLTKDASNALPLLKDIIAEADRGNSKVSLSTLSGALSNLGEILLDAGQYDEAFTTFSRALKIVQRQGGENDPQLIGILIKLGNSEFKRERPLEAEKWYAKASSLMDASGQGETEAYAPVAAALGVIYMNTGRYAEAVPVLKRLVPIADELDKEAGGSTALTARCDLAISYISLKRWKEAKELLAAIIHTGNSITTTGDPRYDEALADRFAMLGRALNDAGLYSEASELLTVSVSMLQRSGTKN